MIVPTKMRFIAHLIVVAALAPNLAACGGGSGDGDERTASGEVLEGSISDEMLPLDQVTSQPTPLEVERTSSPSEGANSEDSAEDEDGAEEPGDAPPIAAELGTEE